MHRWLTAATALVLLTGCGTALARPVSPGPAPGSAEAKALAVARQLVGELRLPSGSARSPRR